MTHAILPAIAGYVLFGEIAADRLCVVYKGTATATQKSVRLHVIDPQHFKGDLKQTLKSALQQIQRNLSPWMLELVIFDLDAPVAYMVTEDGNAPTLLDELRNSGSYSAKEAGEILFAIYAAHTVCWAQAGLEKSKSIASLAQLFHTKDAVHGRVKIDPVSLIIKGLVPSGRSSLAEGFCYLFCQLLGHHFQEFRGRYRFAPIPSLSAETNEFLRQVFQAAPEQFPDLGKIIVALSGKSLADLPTLGPPKIMGPLVHLKAKWPSATQRITLIAPEKTRYLRVAIGEEISLGRSSGDADMVTQFFPRSSMNDSRTFRISRRHGVLRKMGQQITFLEPGASNQSRIDGVKVGENGILLSDETKISLASEFCCQVRLFQKSPDELGGLALEAIEKDSLPFSLLWLFSEISLRASNDGAIEWCQSNASDAAAKLLNMNGTLHVAALIDSFAIVNQVVVPANHCLPLPSEGTLELGAHRWQIALD